MNSGGTPWEADYDSDEAQSRFLRGASPWRQEHRAGLAAKQARVARWEQRAARIRGFESALVPGLLQTRAYAATVLGLADASGQRDLDAAVTARLARQRILEQPSPVIELIVAQAALAWSPAGGEQLWLSNASGWLMRSLPSGSGWQCCRQRCPARQD